MHDYLPVATPLPSFWLAENHDHAFAAHRTTPDLPAHTDVLIIGAGYAGTATAWHLIKDGRQPDHLRRKPLVTLLDARGVCSGATGRNGGHIRPDLYGHIPKYIAREGIEAAVELAEFEIRHVSALKQVVEDEGIDCDFVLSRTVDTWANAEDAASAKTVYDLMAKELALEHMKDVFFHYGPQAEKLSGVKGAKAVGSYTAGMMWPYKFISHLLKSLVASGDVNLQTHTPVTAIEPINDGHDGFTVTTPRGKLHANKIVHASNAYVAGLLPEYAAAVVPCKGICSRITIPTAPAPLVPQTSYIERTEDRTLSYLIPRQVDNSIIVGGAATLFKPDRCAWYNNIDDSTLIMPAKMYYNNYLQRTFTSFANVNAEKVSHLWTGVMGYSYDSHAHVGAVPERPNQFVIAGFNGHGMPVIWLSGKGLAKIMNEGVPFRESGIPRVFETSRHRVQRATNGKKEWGDILGDGSLVGCFSSNNNHLNEARAQHVNLQHAANSHEPRKDMMGNFSSIVEANEIF
nr:gamma-glutamylputrescine oxidoreductase [Quercus suber]